MTDYNNKMVFINYRLYCDKFGAGTGSIVMVISNFICSNTDIKSD